MLAAQAFVPIPDVESYFAALKALAADRMSDFIDYIDQTYLTENSKYCLPLGSFQLPFFFSGKPKR